MKFLNKYYDFDGLCNKWIALGFLWFFAGMAFAPTNRLYQVGLQFSFWMPSLIMIANCRGVLHDLWGERRNGLVAIAALFAWSFFSLLWSDAESGLREIERAVTILLFLFGVSVVSQRGPGAVKGAMVFGSLCFALSAIIAIARFYWVQGAPFSARLYGFGMLEHPILGGYAFAVGFVWLALFWPSDLKCRCVAMIAGMALAAAIALCQSRGVWLALGAALVMFPVVHKSRFRYMPLIVVLITGFGFIFFESYITARGISFRTDIASSAFWMFLERPVLGLGLGSQYGVTVPGVDVMFDHSHNVFLNFAIEFGGVGLLLWCFLWISIGIDGWKSRSTEIGRLIFLTWVFSSVAMSFDGASIFRHARPIWLVSWLVVGLWLASAVSVRAALIHSARHGIRSDRSQCDRFPIV